MFQKNIYFASIVFFIGIVLLCSFILGNNKSVNAQLDSRKADGITVTFFNNITATSTSELFSPAVDVAGFDSIYFHSMSTGGSGSITIQKSPDGTTWFNGQSFSLPNNQLANYDVESKYYRLKLSPSTGVTYYSKAYLKTTH